MVEFGAIRKGAYFLNPANKAFDQYPIQTDPPYIYSEIMNNVQGTNYHWTQHGSATWHYRIMSYGGEFSETAAKRSGLELSRPLTAVVVKSGAKSQAAPAGSLFALTPDTTSLIALKTAEDGRGLIARLYQPEGRPVKARLKFPLQPIARAALTDLVEHDLAPLPVKDGAVEVELGPFAIKTVRLEF